jgi:hypothetical protein
MQKFAVVFIALVAIFATVVPAVLAAPNQPKRETNAQRFARGLAPLKPSRRNSALRPRVSQSLAPTVYRIQICGQYYLQNTANGLAAGVQPDSADLHVIYSPDTNSIQFTDQTFSGGSFFGVDTNTVTMRQGEYITIRLTNVANDNLDSEYQIWSLGPDNQLIPTYTNPDGTTVQPYIMSFINYGLYLAGNKEDDDDDISALCDLYLVQ